MPEFIVVNFILYFVGFVCRVVFGYFGSSNFLLLISSEQTHSALEENAPNCLCVSEGRLREATLIYRTLPTRKGSLHVGAGLPGLSVCVSWYHSVIN